MIDDKEFERIWEQASTLPCAEALGESYEGWLRRRRNARRVATGSLTCCVMALALWAGHAQANRSYDNIQCNRPNIDNEIWIETINDMLTAES